MKAINLKEKFQQINSYWHPHRVAEVDEMHVLLAKVKDDFIWHRHENEDELFQVFKGTLVMQFEERKEIVREGEMLLVPRGVVHCPSTQNGEEVHLILFERKTTAHTGEVQHEKTRTNYPTI